MSQTYGGRWKLEKSLGEGGQAHVFLVTDSKGEGDTHYVLKRLKNINRIERFKREIEAVRNLSHENIIRLIDFDLENETPYLVVEYCSGGSLAEAAPFLSKSPVTALDIFQQICQGVAHAHQQGIIHRDLKPNNIFLRTKYGPAVVADFGICYFGETGDRITLTEEAVGARLFMAPECEDGRLEDISSKSDMYSLGKLLYWLMSGGKIFSREKHRERGFDLRRWNAEKNRWDNIYMEHVNRLLDNLIVVDPEKRASLGEALVASQEIKRLVQKEFIPIAKDILAPCQFCGQGHYLLQVTDNTQLRNFGFTPVGTANWRVLVCNVCGHVQAFRVDMAQRNDWWERK